MQRLLFLLICNVSIHIAAAQPGEPVVYTGMCDASAVVAINPDLFAVANDEDNVLRFYRPSQPGPPVDHCDLAPLLGLERKGEMDLEGAARLGNAFFWIASHGRNASGKFAPNRHRFFALDIQDGAPPLKVRRLGLVITNLADAMAADAKLERFQLAEAARRGPKERGGLSIEGLTATPDGTLLIGFRNPIPQGRALIVPLLNPAEMLHGESPKFGDALLLDLEGHGVRGMASTRDGYYLIAGRAHGPGESSLYFWNGSEGVPERISGVRFPGLNPEAICLPNKEDDKELLILSDDGARNLGGKDCKDLPEPERRFRGCRISL